MQATSATSVWVVSSTLASSRFLAQEWICASQFEIRGEIVVNRQTETFGLTEFKTIGSKHYQIAPTSLDLAMRQADEEFTELLQHKKFPLLDTHQNADPVQAVFTPKEICIMDDFGAVIGLYSDGVWRKPAPKYLWRFMTNMAHKSREEAAMEAEKFQHSEAQELRQYAAYLDEMVDLSVNHRTSRIFREHV